VILVDSSVWIDHLRSADAQLNLILLQGDVIQHGFVTAELALGTLANRELVISRLAALPQAEPADEDGLLTFIGQAALAGTGIGLVDAHLLHTSCHYRHQLWTRDKRLRAQAEKLGCAYSKG
jgi:predicted nucleic acid-binding protein